MPALADQPAWPCAGVLQPCRRCDCWFVSATLPAVADQGCLGFGAGTVLCSDIMVAQVLRQALHMGPVHALELSGLDRIAPAEQRTHLASACAAVAGCCFRAARISSPCRSEWLRRRSARLCTRARCVLCSPASSPALTSAGRLTPLFTLALAGWRWLGCPGRWVLDEA